MLVARECKSMLGHFEVSRRSLLVGAMGAAVITLPGCATTGGGYSLTEAIRRLLLLSSERAFARLVAPGGYWDDQVAAIGLSGLLGTRGNVVANILTSALFKNRLESAFADIAVDGAERAAPLVADAVRTISIQNALALLNGGPNAATGFLRGQMGSTLVEAIVPELGQAMRLTQEPLVGQLLTSLTGVDVAGVSRNFAAAIDNAVWQEIGVEEGAIRANPRSTNDPLLIAVLTGASALR
jgi:hypothetical protein